MLFLFQTFRSIVLGSSGRVNKELGDKILNLVNSEFIDAVKEAMELVKEFKNIAKKDRLDAYLIF